MGVIFALVTYLGLYFFSSSSPFILLLVVTAMIPQFFSWWLNAAIFDISEPTGVIFNVPTIIFSFIFGVLIAKVFIKTQKKI